jgi:uncharacterized protein YndB with AHSA1/START domain
MTQMNNLNAVLSTERVLAANPRSVFAAFANPEWLAQWWGPSGFTNTFEQFEFKPGGRWVFVMHGPDGTNYANESVFREIQPDTRIVIEHVVKPWFRLTVSLTARGNQTHLAWDQEFESPEVAERLRPICEPANEQNLDRLQSLLAVESFEYQSVAAADWQGMCRGCCQIIFCATSSLAVADRRCRAILKV